MGCWYGEDEVLVRPEAAGLDGMVPENEDSRDKLADSLRI
jgi:hypothetical protein